MDTNTIVVVAGIALVFVAGFLIFRSRAKGRVKGPGGFEAEFEGSNEAPARGVGIKAKGIKSIAGGVDIQDATGGGVDAENVDAMRDVKISAGGGSEKKA